MDQAYQNAYGQYGQALQGYYGANGQGGTIGTAAGTMLNNAFDPSGAVYQQGLSTATNNANAQEYSRGIQNSPYGAAVTGQAQQGYNTAYNQQQLSNQQSALSSYYGAMSPYLSGLNQLQSNAGTYMGIGATAQNTAANQASAASASQAASAASYTGLANNVIGGLQNSGAFSSGTGSQAALGGLNSSAYYGSANNYGVGSNTYGFSM